MEQAEQNQIEYSENEWEEEDGNEKAEIEQGPRIHLPEGIFIALLLITAEGISFFLSWATGVGLIASEVIDGVIGIAIELYLILKGVRGARQLATFGLGVLIDEMDGGFFPVETILWLITWYLINHPRAMEKMGSAAQAAKLGK